MLPLDLAPGTTIESLVTDAIPALHARLVGAGGPSDEITVALRIGGRGSWTFHIRGPDMRVAAGEERRPTLWVYTTEGMAERFLRDALGPKRMVPTIAANTAQVGGVLTMSDPRFIRRVAMASGRIELVATDSEGERLSVVFGFGDAARRPIDPEDPDTVVEAPIDTLHSVLNGARGPEEALSTGEVTVRGSRLLAMQLALAAAPFFPKRA
jgi:putative sterol carrier protein